MATRHPEEELARLRELLAANDNATLTYLKDRVEDPDQRATDVADVLPNSLLRSQADDSRLTESLQEPVEQAWLRFSRDKPGRLSEALFPVIGPAIRRAVAEAFRSLSQQINQAVDLSLTAKGVRWRLEARRAGIPFGEYVLQRTLRYRVEQALLINRETGLSIASASLPTAMERDEDAVSAMFTAIQDFVRDTFANDGGADLETADFGDLTLSAVHGPFTVLAVAIRGVPPRSLRSELAAIQETINLKYGAALAEQEARQLPGVEEEVARCLALRDLRANDESGGARFPWSLLLVLALLALVGFAGWQWWQSRQTQSSVVQSLDATPGVVVTDVTRIDGQLIIAGLKDPLADLPQDIGENVRLDMQPYLSLEPELVAARVVTRVIPPPSVRVAMDGTTLRLSGSAESSWMAAALPIAAQISGVEAIDSSALTAVDAAPSLDARLAPLNNVRFQFGDAATLIDGETERLNGWALSVAELAQAAERAGRPLRVSLMGSADASGSDEMNARLIAERVELVAQALYGAGVNPASVAASAEPRLGPAGDVGQRYAAATLALTPTD